MLPAYDTILFYIPYFNGHFWYKSTILLKHEIKIRVCSIFYMSRLCESYNSLSDPYSDLIHIVPDNLSTEDLSIVRLAHHWTAEKMCECHLVLALFPHLAHR